MWSQTRRPLGAALLAIASASLVACGGASPGDRDYASARISVPARAAVDDGHALFAGQTVLLRQALVRAALERNPSIEVARQGWRAALARRSQAESLEDPMLSYSFAPLSIASDQVDYGQVIEVSQALPYPGKRRLRAQVASAEAESEHQDYRATRLDVARMAANLYYELYGIDRSLAIYAEYERELNEHRQTLTAHLAAGHAWQDDALKVDVDLGEVEQMQIDLQGERDVVAMQINALLHRSPMDSLPPLPDSLAAPAPVDGSRDQLAERALRERPELRAAEIREDLGASRVALANRDFYPDFRVMGQYNSMWPRIEHGLMVGVAMSVPLWRDGRHGALRQAEAQRLEARAGLQLAQDRVRVEVARAYRAFDAALRVVRNYESDLMPPARDRVHAVRSGLDTGRTSFIEVLRADHELLAIRLRYEKAVANAHWRRVQLEIATGELEAHAPQGAAR